MRETLNRSFDARQVPSILARPSGGNPEGVVVFSELDQLVRNVLDKVAELRREVQEADQADLNNWSSAVSTLQRQFDERLDGVRATYPVAAQVSTLAQARVDLPGLDPTSTTWRSWFAVAGDVLAENGVYRFENGVPVRVQRFTAASSLQAGMRLYDDTRNRYWNISADAVPDAGGGIASVEITPGFSPDETAPGDGLERAVNRFNVLLDSEALRFVDNRITLSVALQNRIAELVDSAADQQRLIDSLEEGLARVTADILAIASRTEANETAIRSHTAQIEDVQSAVQAFEPRIGSVERLTIDLGTRTQSLERSDTQQQQTINQQGQLIDGLGQRVIQHDTTLSGHTQQLGQQQRAIESVDAAVVDARSTIAAHTQQITEIDRELDGKLNTADLEAAQETKLASLVKVFILTGGVTERRNDADDNSPYYFTTFTQSTGWGHLRFRQFDLSETLSPYTKRGYSFTFQRVGVDSFQIIFQSVLAAFPDDLVDVALIRIPSPLPTEIPGWEKLGYGWQGEVLGTFGEARLRAILVSVQENTPENVTFHFKNGAVLTRDGWYNLDQSAIESYIGL